MKNQLSSKFKVPLILIVVSTLIGIIMTFRGEEFSFRGMLNNILAAAILVFIGYFIVIKKKHKASVKSSTSKSGYGNEVFFVAGAGYYSYNLEQLSKENEDYNKDAQTLANEGKLEKAIYEYKYKNSPVELVPEPENKNDSNAIRVDINGLKIGYISREENLSVKKILGSGNVEKISAFIGGGKYKKVMPDLSVINDEKDISIKITIKQKSI